MEISDIPRLNAFLNTIATALLAIGFLAIRNGNRDLHRKCMISAFVVSCLFLIGYVSHKYAVNNVHTKFTGEGIIAIVYYVMLISHIILAAVIVPLVAITFTFALKGNFERHRKWARWTFPTWLYVSVTGVLIYMFLYVWYPSAPELPVGG